MKYLSLIILLIVGLSVAVHAQEAPEVLDLWEYDIYKTPTHIVVDWAFPCGPDAAHFIVEKSRDLITFSEVQRLEAFCTGGLTYYQTKDTEPYLGASYYRVKMYSTLSNKYIISNWKKVVFNKNGENFLSFYPNPLAKGENLRVLWESTGGERVEIKAISMDGKEITLLPAENVPPGIHEKLFDLTDWNPGLYFLKIEKGESSVRELIVIE